MSAIQILSSQPWVERLGWTLVHFLWQGVSIAIPYAAARRSVARTSSPNVRHLIACAALAAMMAAPLLTWGLMGPSDASPDAAYLIRSVPAAPSTTAATIALPASVRANLSDVGSPQFLPWVVIVWLTGTVVLWVRLAGSWVVAARMRSTLVRPAPPEWQEALRRLGARIGFAPPVRLLVSALAEVPTVVGWLRPVVLVPVGALSGLPPEHLEALLLHELAHIRRHDYLVNILQSVAEALLFYHPAIWWVSGHMRAERELCCDDVAVSVSGDAITYARALAQLESYRPAHLNAAVAANGGSLSNRIARLLGQSRPSVRTGLGPGVLAVAILLMAAAYGLFGQSGARPAFEAASIKPSAASEQGGGVRAHPGGRLSTQNAPLMILIQTAYSVQRFQIVGGPGWTNSDGYDIEAKPAVKTNRKEMWLMLQSLLADRFKLTLHREMREQPVYVLTAAKSGLKLPPPKEGACIPNPPDEQPAPLGTDQVYCGGFHVQIQSTGGQRLEGIKLSMTEFSKDLARVVGRPVLDKTGFGGEFDVRVEFAPNAPATDFDAVTPKTDPNLPNIFTALQEQLGLKLAPAKGPVEVLVIDHVERPTAN